MHITLKYTYKKKQFMLPVGLQKDAPTAGLSSLLPQYS
jgi:hypothetical protein